MANFTEQAIIKALSELLQDKPLDKISVKELTDACGISRNTFYYHFHDIYEAVSKFFVQAADELVERYRKKKTWEEGFTEGLNLLYRNKKILNHIYKSISRDELEKFLNRMVYYHTRIVVDRESEGRGYSQEVISIAADFYKNALLGAIMNWIDRDMKEKPDYLATLYNSVFTGTIDSVLESIRKVM